jgi:uncharacterized GH25 family protein
MKSLYGRISVFLICAVWPVVLLAHDTWLAPGAGRYKVAPGSAVQLDLTSGMVFPTLDYAVKAPRIEHANVRLAGKTSAINDRRAGPKSLRLTARLSQPGVATLWVQLAPKALELTPDKVTEYLDEIGALPEIRRVWDEGGAARRWREVYTKHAKTYVRVGEPGDDRSWAEPVGLGLEIVPAKDPTGLRAGDELPILVLRGGKPFPSFPVGLVREGEAHGILKTTDAEGRITFRLDKAGRWLLRGTDLRQSTKPTTEWESDFTTLTLEIR